MATKQPSLTLALQVLGISLSLLGTGMNIGFDKFAIDALKTQPASVSLPTVRWLFSRGSHTIPTMIFLSSTCKFAVLSVLPPPVLGSLLSHRRLRMGPLSICVGYLGAAACNAAIGVVTMRLMLANNFRLIEMNEQKGGARSLAAAKFRQEEQVKRGKPTSAEESTAGVGQPNQFTDLSGPQPRTEMDTTPEEDREVQEMLKLFTRQNLLRIALSGTGGVLGLIMALA